ncbi:MAG: superoxide dismutase [Oscillospiraceae bacterium]|nr:superoxide dismutase [Oscillospiraceae bacterium]
MQYPYQLPALPYAYEALSPMIGDPTLHVHHDKHLKTYVDNLNQALSDCSACQAKPLEELLRDLDQIPETKRTSIRNNGGGVYNHLLYFDCMAPAAGGQPKGSLSAALDREFGSYAAWQEKMKEAALGQFGSGYAWLVCDSSGTLSVVKTANQDCPLTGGLWPILCVDVWEHAYYLDYQNRRADYLDAWFNCINWDFVQKRYDQTGL